MQEKKEMEMVAKETTTFDIEWAAYEDEHTLTMFYMERGMWESNMMIAFNFPDDNEFAVEKQVDKSEVNPLFADSFEDASIFPFTIKNQATHYGTKEAGSGATVVDQGNLTALTAVHQNWTKGSSDITFERLESIPDQSDQNGVAHWYAPVEDTTGEHKNSRFGIIPYQVRWTSGYVSGE